MLAEGPGLGLGQLKKGTSEPFVTPNFDGSKVSVYDMIFDRDGNLWVGTVGKGLFRIHGNVVEHYGRTEGLSSDTVRLFLKTERESYGLRLRMESTAFAIRGSSLFRQWKDWGRMQQQAFWPAEMARSGLQTLDRSITSLTGASRPFARAMVFRVIKLPQCWKTAPATYGWEWMTDCICSRMGDSAASPNRITSRLDWWLELPRTSTEIFGQSAQAIRESWCAFAISRCVKSFLRRKFHLATRSRPIHTEEFG